MGSKHLWKTSTERLEKVTYESTKKLYFKQYPYRLVIRAGFTEPIINMFSNVSSAFRSFHNPNTQEYLKRMNTRTLSNSVIIEDKEKAAEIFFRKFFFDNSGASLINSISRWAKPSTQISSKQIRHPNIVIDNETIDNIFADENVNELETMAQYLHMIYQTMLRDDEIDATTICTNPYWNMEYRGIKVPMNDYIYELSETILALIKFYLDTKNEFLHSRIRYKFQKASTSYVPIIAYDATAKIVNEVNINGDMSEIESISIYSNDLILLHDFIKENPCVMPFIEVLNAPSAHGIKMFAKFDDAIFCENGIPHSGFTKRLKLSKLGKLKIEERDAISHLLLNYDETGVCKCTNHARKFLRTHLVEEEIYGSPTFSMDVDEQYLDSILDTLFLVSGDQINYTLNTLIED